MHFLSFIAKYTVTHIIATIPPYIPPPLIIKHLIINLSSSCDQHFLHPPDPHNWPKYERFDDSCLHHRLHHRSHHPKTQGFQSLKLMHYNIKLNITNITYTIQSHNKFTLTSFPKLAEQWNLLLLLVRTTGVEAS